MCGAEFGFHDPIAGRCATHEAIVTKSLSEYFLLFAAIQTLIAQEVYFERFAQKLVKAKETVFKYQIILNGIGEFGLHFGKNAFVCHWF
jgi:septum formation inhibitor-activating ATPase MinD